MERLTPEHDFRPKDIEPNLEVEESSVESVEGEAGKVFDEAVNSVADVFEQVQVVADNGNTEEQEKAQSIKKEASSALATLYKKMRKIALATSLFVGATGAYGAYAYSHKKENTNYADGQHLDRGKLSPKLAFVDIFISSDLVDTYNKCVDFLKKRKDGKMSLEEIAFKEQIAQRFLPFGYSDLPVVSELWAASQIKTGEVQYTKESLSPHKKNIKETLSDAVMTDDKIAANRIRVDMFRKYLGLEQFFNTMMPSEFKPNLSKNPEAQYAQFDNQEVLKSIFNPATIIEKYGGPLVGTPNFDVNNQNFDALVNYVQKNNKLPRNNFMRQLGKYKAYIGFDKERNDQYISYYDLWDIDPPQLKKMGIEVDQFNFPFEVYGRIYKSDFDKFLQSQQVKQRT